MSHRRKCHVGVCVSALSLLQASWWMIWWCSWLAWDTRSRTWPSVTPASCTCWWNWRAWSVRQGDGEKGRGDWLGTLSQYSNWMLHIRNWCYTSPASVTYACIQNNVNPPVITTTRPTCTVFPVVCIYSNDVMWAHQTATGKRRGCGEGQRRDKRICPRIEALCTWLSVYSVSSASTSSVLYL